MRAAMRPGNKVIDIFKRCPQPFLNQNTGNPDTKIRHQRGQHFGALVKEFGIATPGVS